MKEKDFCEELDRCCEVAFNGVIYSYSQYLKKFNPEAYDYRFKQFIEFQSLRV